MPRATVEEIQEAKERVLELLRISSILTRSQLTGASFYARILEPALSELLDEGKLVEFVDRRNGQGRKTAYYARRETIDNPHFQVPEGLYRVEDPYATPQSQQVTPQTSYAS